MAQVSANVHGEILMPGRVPDCYVGLRLESAGHDEEAAGVLAVAPATFAASVCAAAGWHRAVRPSDRHPDRTPHELVTLADLEVELRSWPAGSAATYRAGGWVGLTAQKAMALERPTMTYVHA